MADQEPRIGNALARKTVDGITGYLFRDPEGGYVIVNSQGAQAFLGAEGRPSYEQIAADMIDHNLYQKVTKEAAEHFNCPRPDAVDSIENAPGEYLPEY